MEVVRARWVGSPAIPAEKKCRLITAEESQCGIDAAFHLVEMIVGPDWRLRLRRGWIIRGEERSDIDE
jgi:hypothetical protein